MKLTFLLLILITLTAPNLHAQDVKANHIEGKWVTSRETEPASMKLDFLLKIDGTKGRIIDGDKVAMPLYDSITYDGNGVWSAIAYKPVINKDNTQSFRMVRSQAVKLRISADKYSLFEIPGNIELLRRGMYPGEQEEIDRIIKTLPDIPRPSDEELSKLCYRIDKHDVEFNSDLKKMAGVTSSDPPLLIKAKVQKFWKTYYMDLGCDSSGFSVEFGNILKFSTHRSYSWFIDVVKEKYNVNIDIPDPVDGKTLLDFVQDEILRFEKIDNQIEKVKELKDIYIHLKNDLGAKHAVELK
ncbi:hypothetical protein [Pedobacter alpinus]|uniref:DUF4369 domain-containing protein n=1 Tax=Pedobacter alpinus TaxID=1590643 RepID=A0ABW5TR12_9SPHI